MPEQTLSALIAGLSATEQASRQDSAAQIFRLGSQLLGPVLRQWLADPELANCIANETRGPAGSQAPGVPQVTVGVAVEPERFEAIRAANGSPPLADVPPDQDAQEFELDFRGEIRLDVLTSRNRSGSGAIARFLQKFGEAIQQVEVNVNDVDRATQILRMRFGVAPIYPASRPGANGTRVNFFLVSVAGGKLLVELVQG